MKPLMLILFFATTGEWLTAQTLNGDFSIVGSKIQLCISNDSQNSLCLLNKSINPTYFFRLNIYNIRDTSNITPYVPAISYDWKRWHVRKNRIKSDGTECFFFKCKTLKYYIELKESDFYLINVSYYLPKIEGIKDNDATKVLFKQRYEKVSCKDLGEILKRAYGEDINISYT